LKRYCDIFRFLESIHDFDKTIVSASILTYMRSHRHVILRLAAKYRRNQSK